MRSVFVLAFAIAVASAASMHSKLPTKEIKDPNACDIQEGEACQPDDCFHCGYCWEMKSHYFRCVREFPDDPKLNVTGTWKQESCDESLWWNPDLRPAGQEVGGSCDRWSSLSDAVKEEYRKECAVIEPICEWGQDKPCSKHYWYWDPATMAAGEREDLSCNDDLIWDPATETCRERENVDGCGEK